MVDETCALCTQPAKQRCGGCQVTYYCSRDHQRLDWKTHRSRCKPFKVVENETLGRHLIATRDLKVGEVILQEEPLVAGPSQVTPPVCLGCYSLLTEECATACPDCGWPVCSEKCARSSAHRAECDITKLKRKAKITVRNFLQPHPIYQCVSALRCLYLRDSNPAMWERLQSLQSHCANRKATPRYEADRVTVAQFVRRFFNLHNFEEEEILRICGILQVNGHEVPLTEPPHLAVYHEASMLEHSCRPNCAKSFTPGGGLIIHVVEPVLKGQHLSICYTDALWGTANRRHHLAETKFFWCRCNRCADPTEFGTYFSAVHCLNKPCEGYLLPEDPLLEETELEKTTWRCSRCLVSESAPKVLSVLERVGVALSSMQKGDPEACQRFLGQYTPQLHPNHYYLTDVRIALAQLLGQNCDVGLPGVSDHDLTEKISLCRQVLALVNTLVPAEHRVRGLLMFELHAALSELGRRESERGRLDSMNLRDTLLAGIQEIADGSGLPSKPRAGNTSGGNGRPAGQGELNSSEYPSAENTRVYWRQPPLARISQFYNVQSLDRTWPSSFKFGSSRTETSAQGLTLSSFPFVSPGKFWGSTASYVHNFLIHYSLIITQLDAIQPQLLETSSNKTGNVRINVTLRRFHVTIVAVEK